MADRLHIAQDGANVFYPAVTAAELSNEELLLANYRRSLGLTRMLTGGVVVLGCAWLFDHFRKA